MSKFFKIYYIICRYDLHIIGEHEFKVEHCLLALPGSEEILNI